MASRAQPLRIVVRRNKKRFGKVVVVQPDISWELFVDGLVKKEVVSKEHADDISLFLSTGDEIDDLDELRDSDVVYICTGTEKPQIPKSDEVALADALNKLANQLARGGAASSASSSSASSGGASSEARAAPKKKKSKRQRTLKVYDVTVSNGEHAGRKGTINARYADSETLKVYLDPLDGGDMSEIVSIPSADVSVAGEPRKKVMERRKRAGGEEGPAPEGGDDEGEAAAPSGDEGASAPAAEGDDGAAEEAPAAE